MKANEIGRRFTMTDWMKLDIDPEEILFKVKARMDVSLKNILAGMEERKVLIYGGLDIGDIVILILTRDKLVVVYKARYVTEHVERIRRVEEFQLTEIENFQVEDEEEEEKIIFRVKAEEFVYFRDNRNKDYLARELAKELNHIRLGNF